MSNFEIIDDMVSAKHGVVVSILESMYIYLLKAGAVQPLVNLNLNLNRQSGIDRRPHAIGQELQELPFLPRIAVQSDAVAEGGGKGSQSYSCSHCSD